MKFSEQTSPRTIIWYNSLKVLVSNITKSNLLIFNFLEALDRAFHLNSLPTNSLIQLSNNFFLVNENYIKNF